MSHCDADHRNPSRTAVAFHNGDHCAWWGGGCRDVKSLVMMIQELLRRGFVAPRCWRSETDGLRLVRATYPEPSTTPWKRLASDTTLLSPVRQTAPDSVFPRWTTGRYAVDGVYLIALEMRQTQNSSQWSSRWYSNEAREVAFEVYDTCKERVGRFLH